MTIPRLPRDGDEELEEAAEPRRERGRRVAERTRAEIEIIVDGEHLGTVYPNELTAEAQFQLEEMTKAVQLIDWLANHAGANRDKARQAIGGMPIARLFDVASAISETIAEAVEVPKAKRRR